MALRFTVLASGSGGNVSLVETDSFGVLIDAGLGPRLLGERLAAAGLGWSRVHAVLLTHTHSDHWDDGTLTQLWQREIAFYCHPSHRSRMRAWSSGFQLLESVNLVRDYEAGQDLRLSAGLRCVPLPLRHDGGPTFGFRLEDTPDLFGGGTSLAYAADLGCWDGSLAASLADVDLLALEFNHDVDLEVRSGRSVTLVSRVLGDEGHLSNDQAADLFREVLRRSSGGRPSRLVQLHLSRECNRPLLAEEAARKVAAELGRAVAIHPASQNDVSPTWLVGQGAASPRKVPSRRRTVRRSEGSWLPGLEPG